MPYKRDPKKRLALLLHSAMDKGHKYAVIHVITDRLIMSGCDERMMKAFAGWTEGMQLVNVKDHLSALPRVTC